MRSTQGLGFLLAGLLALSACQADPRPNVLLITLDTTRADHLGAMGDTAARTPTLDALAARGALFERAYASTPRTLPSHTTILTGLEIDQHRVRDNGQFFARDAGETLAERLGARGYATAAFVAAAVLDSVFGLDRGFDIYDDDIPWDQRPLNRTVPQRRGEVVVDHARAWLEQRPRGPFFLWVHLYDPHSPRDPPAPFAAMEDPYAAEIAYADAQVARLLDAVERATAGQDTLIVVIGDHGESLGEHDEPTHGITAYDSTLHVPLIAVGPGFPPGERTARFVQSVDVTPTILAAIRLRLGGHRGRPDGSLEVHRRAPPHRALRRRRRPRRDAQPRHRRPTGRRAPRGPLRGAAAGGRRSGAASRSGSAGDRPEALGARLRDGAPAFRPRADSRPAALRGGAGMDQ